MLTIFVSHGIKNYTMPEFSISMSEYKVNEA